MFKKLKDKIAEEVKQSPLRLPTSVQQHLSQYSPFTRETQSGDCAESQTEINNLKECNPSYNRTQETLVDIAEDSGETASNHFSIADEENRLSSLSTVKEELAFQPISLNDSRRENVTSTPQPPIQGRLSRQSSLSSVFSDVSFLPGSSDSAYHPYQFQSDLESNVSEFDDSASQSGRAVDRISKEHVFNAYQKMRTRYHKYKGRYSDLARHYKELEREKDKVKHVLAETQDRSLRRISELKEQCALEQQAKAHLEENLRSDLEEKDNIIAVLQTKVKLLASPSKSETSEGVLVDLNSLEGSETSSESHKAPKDEDLAVLKEKIQRFEALLLKSTENIKSKNERINELQTENENLKRNNSREKEEYESSQRAHREHLAQLTESLNMARKEIETLRHQEQEAALAAAETKQKVHAELLKQEEEMNRLRTEREQLHIKVNSLETEMTTVKDEMTKQLQESETALELEKQRLLKELSRGKTEALKLMDEDMDNRLEDLRKEKDAYWEAIIQKKSSEEAENHARTLRQLEENYRTRLAELQEEKSLALEEKELHFASLLAREQSNLTQLNEEIISLKSQIESKEKLIEKVKEEGLEERRSWVKQIEDNRQRHLEEMDSLTQQNESLRKDLEQRHTNAIDLAVLELKQLHSKEIEKIQQQHEELLQAANEDMESSAKVQLEQLRSLLRDKESEMMQRNAALQELEGEVKSKDIKLADLLNQIQNQAQQLSSMELMSEQLNEALRQVKEVNQLNEELNETKGNLVVANSSILEMQKEIDSLRMSGENDRAQVLQLQQQFEERSQQLLAKETEVNELRQSFEELQSSVNNLLGEKSELGRVNHELTEKLSTTEADASLTQKSLASQEERVSELTTELKQLSLQLDESKLKYEQEKEELRKTLSDKSSEVERLNDAIVNKDRHISELEQVQSLWSADQSDFKARIQEQAEQLNNREMEIEELKMSVEKNLKRCLDLESEMEVFAEKSKQKEAESQAKVIELLEKLEAAHSENAKAELSVTTSNQTIQELQVEKQTWIDEKIQLQAAIQEKDQELMDRAQESKNLFELSQTQEKRIAELNDLVSQNSHLLEAKDRQLEQSTQDLSKQLTLASAELDELRNALAVKDQTIVELEQARNTWSSQELSLKAQVDEYEHRLKAKESELEVIFKSLENKEERVNQLEKELELIKNNLDMQDSELMQTNQKLSSSLQSAKSKLKELKNKLASKDDIIQQLEITKQDLQTKASIIETTIAEKEQIIASKNLLIQEQQQDLDLKHQKISDLETNIELSNERLSVLSSDSEAKLHQLTDALESAKSELEINKSNLSQKETQILHLEEQMKKNQEFLDQNQHKVMANETQLASQSAELGNLTLLKQELESKVRSLEVIVEEKEKLLMLKDAEVQSVNSKSEANESVIKDLQGELERNAQLLSTANVLVEEQQQKLKLIEKSLEEKETEAAEYKSQLENNQSELNRVAQLETELQRQVDAKKECIREMEENHRIQMDKLSQQSSEQAISNQQLFESRLRDKENELRLTNSNLIELKEQLAVSKSRFTEIQSEKGLLEEKCLKLSEDLQSRQNQTDSLEQMENQIKTLQHEVSTLNEDKNRLETLCKRFKVQLADTRKLLSASKASEAAAANKVSTDSTASLNEENRIEASKTLATQSPPKQTNQESESNGLLEQQVAVLQRELDVTRHQYKMEVSELRRLVEMGKAPVAGSSGASNGASNFHGSLEEATELEYLRNILFEYMMGRQPATLAKVVAAVVKFTPEQTRKITEREEQRQSLLGHLGLA